MKSIKNFFRRLTAWTRVEADEERLRIEIGSAFPLSEEMVAEISGA